jgi:hypothetical protein
MPEAGKIIRIRDWTALDELSNPVEAKRVTFAYPDGTPTHVDIPVREFTTERVRQAIEEAIAQWREVMGS